jgi:hypothetical protein
MKIKRILLWPFFPFLLVALAILDFYLSYFYEISHQGLLVATLLSLFLIAIVWLILYWLIRDLNKSALIVFFIAIFFFEFQSIVFSLRSTSYSLKAYNLFRYWNSNNGQLTIFFFFLILVIILFIYLKKLPKVNRNTIRLFNLLSLLVLMLSIGRGASLLVQNRQIPTNFYHYWQNHLAELPIAEVSTELKTPDIYYIILDGFGRNDVLKGSYGIDNTPFLHALEDRGFYIADKSYTNYNQTITSLASSLNMMYLDEIAETLGENTDYYYAASYMISHSTVEEMLKDLSYQTVGFFSESSFSDFTKRDYYFRPQFIPPSFYKIYLYNTALSVILNSKFYDWHRDTITYTLDTLPEAATLKGPQFIFAHILCPHPPFVFNNDGTPREAERIYSIEDANRYLVDGTLEEYRSGYRNQLIYLQNTVLSMVDRIQKNSTEPFILIIQGDHGPGSETNHDTLGESNFTERYGILNAIYFFDRDYSRLYPQISPVNTFRVIFSQYLGVDYPLLDDLHYGSTYGDSFNFESVNDKLE